MTTMRLSVALLFPLLTCILLSSSVAWSPPLPPAAADSVAFDVEYVNVASDSANLSRLNVYLRIVYDEVQFIKASKDSFRAQYKATITMLDTSGAGVDSSVFTDAISIASLDDANSTSKFRLRLIVFDLPPDEYTIDIKVKDIETDHEGKYNSGPIKLKEYLDQGFLASDILFLDNATKGPDGKVIWQPRVSNVQSNAGRILMYFEVYNVLPEDSFKVHYEVLDSDGKVLLEHEYWQRGDGRRTQNIIDIEGETLTHGSYATRVRVTYGDQTYELGKPFNWYLEGLPLEFTDIAKAIRVLKYIANKDDYKKLMHLDKENQYKGFVKFWKSRDPTPLTPDNDVRDRYYKRVAFANKQYATLKREGWTTDMGWVYIVLGPPDVVNRDTYNQSFSTIRTGKTVKAVQSWVYYQYNRQLLFYDTTGFGNFRLENPETLYEIVKF